jgi:hypothetical protein
MRERVCCLQLLLVLASTAILGSEPCGTHDCVLLSQIRDSPNIEGQVPVFISPKNRVAQLYHQTLVKVKVKVTLRLMVSQSVSLGVKPHLGLMTRYLLLFDSYGLVFVGRILC